jgi:multiple sugar transport system ATP-binding protein
MAGILIYGLTKYFQTIPAVDRIDLEIAENEFLVLLGPSGCGKTTTLRCIAGLEQPDWGEIYIGEQCVYSDGREIDVPPKQRDAGFVFQNYALYPHMTVYKNVAFGLTIRKTSKSVIRSRVEKALRLVDLEGFEDRLPKQLSGGQQQRVAIARTIVRNPHVLLFDEPLSNLDPKLRVPLRAELKQLHRRIGSTALYVTHDQTEAMVLGDRIAVMRDGRIEQIAKPGELYRNPKTIFTANFTGNPKTNFIEGEVHAYDGRLVLIPKSDPFCFIPLPDECRRFRGSTMVFHIRPEDIDIVPAPGEEEGRLTVYSILPQGSDVLVYLRLGEYKDYILAKIEYARAADLHRGQPVSIRLLRGNLFGRESEQLISSFEVQSALKLN